MTNELYLSNWNTISARQLDINLKQSFPSVLVYPDNDLLLRLKSLKKAILYLYEERSSSTVYQIGETGEIFQIYSDGQQFNFSCSEEYGKKLRIDGLVVVYHNDYPEFIASNHPNNLILVTYLDHPNFVVHYSNGIFDKVVWVDQKPRNTEQEKWLLQKAEIFYNSIS